MTDYPPPPPPPPTPPPPGGYPGQYGSPLGPVDAQGRPLAEWWQRLVAIIVDFFIVAIPSFMAAGVGASVAGNGGAFLGGLALATAYYGLLNGGERGQTVGKMALGIQVRDASAGGPIGPGRGAVRYLVVGVGAPLTFGLFALLDGLWPLWDPGRQALHDKVAGSVVIKRPVL